MVTEKIYVVVDASGEYLTPSGKRSPASNEAREFESRRVAELARERETDRVVQMDAE